MWPVMNLCNISPLTLCKHKRALTGLNKHTYWSGCNGSALLSTFTQTFISFSPSAGLLYFPLSSSLSPSVLPPSVSCLPSPLALLFPPRLYPPPLSLTPSLPHPSPPLCSSLPPLPSVMVMQCSLFSSSASARAAPSLALVPSFPEYLIALA